MKWNLFLATGQKLQEDQDDLKNIKEYIGNEQTTFWLDIEDLNSESDFILEEFFKAHPLAIEDCHNPKVRPKIEKFDHHLFIVFRGINFNPGEEETDFINIYYFLGDNYIITVHQKPLRAINDTKRDLEQSYDLLVSNPGKVLYESLDRLVDNFFPTLDKLDKGISEIEQKIFYNFSDIAVENIFQMKKKVMLLKRSIGPQLDLMDSLLSRQWSFIRHQNIPYYRDIRDHLDRLADHLDMYRDLTISLLDSYMTQVSNRMNEIMKILSIVATIMLPLSLMTGIFGMNFEVLPGLKVVWGFWGLMISMILVTIVMLGVFKWKKWL
jgi:magnesium transporter